MGSAIKAGLYLTYCFAFYLKFVLKMRKLFLSVACAVILTIVLFSPSSGAEQSQEVEEVFERGVRKAGGISGQAVRKSRKTSGRRKNLKNGRRNKKLKSAKFGKRSNPKKHISVKKGKRIQKKKFEKKRKAQKSGKTLQTKEKGNTRPKSTQTGCSRQTTTFCPAEKASALKLLYNQVYNFKKQLKRAQNQAKIVKKKKEKKDIFQKDAAIVTDIVGGNLTEPTCSATGRSASSAASQGSILSSCSTTIATSCEEITINSTLSGTCSDTMITFETKVTACRTSDSCSCWTEAFAMKSAITQCNAVKEANSVKVKKKTCLKTFGDCKSAQDSAVEYTATCTAQTSSATTMATASTTKSAKRRNIVEKFLARNLMRRSHHNEVSA